MSRRAQRASAASIIHESMGRDADALKRQRDLAREVRDVTSALVADPDRRRLEVIVGGMVQPSLDSLSETVRGVMHIAAFAHALVSHLERRVQDLESHVRILRRQQRQRQPAKKAVRK